MEVTPFGDFIVRVRVGAEENVPFKLDTGAAMSTLYADFAGLGTPPTHAESVDVWGLGGTARRPVSRLSSLAFGHHTYTDLPVAVLADSRPETGAVGILGMDVLKDWALESRASTGERTLYPVREVRWRRFAGWDLVPLRVDPFGRHAFGLRFGTIGVMGTDVPALFDLGSHLSIMNWEAANLVPEMHRYWERTYEAWRYYGAVGEFHVSGTSVIADVAMGEARWDRVEVILTDLDSLSPLGAVGQPFMIAGANMFTGRDFVFNPAGNEIRVRGTRNASPGVVVR